MIPTSGVSVSAWELQIKGLSKAYSDNILFQDLSFDIKPGEAVHIQGPNGSGKTQLMLVLAGLIEADKGGIYLRGQNQLSLSTQEPSVRARSIRFIPCLPGGIAELPLELALLVISGRLQPFGLRSQHTAAQEVITKIWSEVNAICDGKTDIARPLCHHSVGQQKRLMMAASVNLSPFPHLLMLDEPLAGLDDHGVERVLAIIHNAQAQGIAVMISEHRREIHDVRFSEVVHLPYRTNEQHQASTFVASTAAVSTDPDKSETLVLSIKNLSSGYRNCPVFCRNLNISPGDLVVIQGANGSGKTGFVRGLFRHPGTIMSGTLEFDGAPVTDLRLAQRQSQVRYLSQVRDLFPDLTVRESVTVAGDGRKSELQEEVSDIVRIVGPNKYVGHLSSGQQALVALAQALAGKARLLILDEPVANTDTVNRERVWDVINGVRAHRRIGVLVVEHDAIPDLFSAVYQIENDNNSASLVRIA